jgi:hypothetical protein
MEGKRLLAGQLDGPPLLGLSERQVHQLLVERKVRLDRTVDQRSEALRHRDSI